jgi:integrase
MIFAKTPGDRKCGLIEPGTILDTPNFAFDPATRPYKAGVRPFRKGSYRLEPDQSSIPGKLIVHNYGHGGAGITMSWGCAEIVREIVRHHDTSRGIAVLGAGVMGLTAATLLRDLTGTNVTVFAEKFTPNTTSDVAGGQWSPSLVRYDENDSAAELAYFDVLRRARKAHEMRGAGYGVSQRWNYTPVRLTHLDKLPSDIVPSARAGISRTTAQTEIVRRAKPLLAVDLRDIVERLKPNKPIDVRAGALLTVGWAGALRRRELVGLDWASPGDGTGFVAVDERGIVITLMTSNASLDAAEHIVIPWGDMPAACQALEAWTALAGLQPRQRVFCPIDQHGHLSPKHLTGHSVSAVQTRMRRLEYRRGKTRKDAKAAAALFSGHSLRAGYAEYLTTWATTHHRPQGLRPSNPRSLQASVRPLQIRQHGILDFRCCAGFRTPA